MKYKKIYLIGNPIAGGGALKKIKLAQHILKSKNIQFETFLTKKQGDAEIFAKHVKSEHINESKSILVLAAGGDGTYNEVINGLCFSDIPLAILPMGTTSVLAKELKIPNSINKAIDIALKGTVKKVHLGKIKNKEKQRFFILMAGIGFDGEAVYNVNPENKRYLKKIAYIMSGLKTLLKFKPKELKIINSENKKAYTAVVCKASCYGGNFKIAPHANLIEPNFYIFLSKTSSKITFITQILGVIFGYHLKMKKTDYFKTESIKIFGNAHVQIDGDYFGKAPVEIKIAKNALNLVFPVKN
jgi:YegS/Rv2252/BmrU family lipid kinase